MIVGVDIDSFKATLCAVPFGGGPPLLAEARWRPDGKSGDALYVLGAVPHGLRVACEELASASPDRFAAEPTLWFVERGFGASRRSDFIIGAFTGAVFAVIADRLDRGDQVNLMEAREWKREVTGVSGIGTTKKGTGNANAKKEVANEACRALMLLDEVEPVDWTPDALDAWGISFTGRRLNQRALDAA